MRKLIFILFMLLYPCFVKAQSAFQQKDLFISAGLSGGNYRGIQYYSSERAGRSVPLFVSVEYGVKKAISVGPFAGYYFGKYRYNGRLSSDSTNIIYKSHYTVVGVRGTVHFTELLEKKMKTYMYSEDLDLYASVLLGYELNRFSRLDGVSLDNKSRPVAGVVVGARYFINYRLAFFAEFGPGIFGLGSLGVTARF